MKVAARRALVIPALFLTIGINGLAQDKTSGASTDPRVGLKPGLRNAAKPRGISS